MLVQFTIIFPIFVHFPIAQPHENELWLCSFNVGIVDKTIMENDAVMDVYAQIFKKYDLCLIEIDGKDDIAKLFLRNLLDRMNRNQKPETDYQMVERITEEDIKLAFIFDHRTIHPEKSYLPRATDHETRALTHQIQPPFAIEVFPIVHHEHMMNFMVIGAHMVHGLHSVEQTKALIKYYRGTAQKFQISDAIVMGNMKVIDNIAAENEQLPNFHTCIASVKTVNHGATNQRICAVGTNMIKRTKDGKAWNYKKDIEVPKDVEAKLSSSLPVEVKITTSA